MPRGLSAASVLEQFFGFVIAPCKGAGADHGGEGKLAAEAPVKHAQGQIGDARKGGKHERRLQYNGADFQHNMSFKLSKP